MTTSEADRCPECGAPLHLDDNDDCIYCHAHVTIAAHAGMILGRDWNGDASEPAYSILSVMYDLWEYDVIQEKVIGQSLLPAVKDLPTAVETAGLAANEKRRHPDKAVHSYHFDVDWYSPPEIWLMNLGKDLVYWLTDGTNLPGFAPHLERELGSRKYRHAVEHAGSGPEQLQALRSTVPSFG
ncbi:MAG TPA: hypothetical protein VG476_13655 [Acidimicrobiales bacterium]|nr:hypothetical protein [Acidimicrobiales bacterium]